jgi:RND family efflux transporter MFP subunit
MRQLQWGVAWLQNWVLRHHRVATGEPARARLEPVLELTARVLEEPGFRPAATAFVTELAARLGCDRVSLGFLRGKEVKVHALSHSAQFGKQMNLIRCIGMSMMESIDQQAVLLYPDAGAGRHILQSHEQLARAHGDGAILTVPFTDHEGRAFGALTAERSAVEPFEPEDVALCDAVTSLAGPVLEEKRRNDRLLVRKIAESLWGQVKRLIGPRHTARKIVATILVGLVLFLTFARGTYRVTAKTVLEGEVQRVVAAPFPGFVFEAPVRAGDLVTEGQLMCRLDDRDIRLEYSRWSSEREQYLAEHRKAMAEGNRAEMNVFDKKMKQAEAQLALLQEQIERTRIAAPFDGLVVSGDLTQALGSPVEVGQVLFEVAPLDSYRVMLQVDQRDIATVREGQRGELVLTALPDARLPFEVEKTTPVSLSEEGRSYFLVEATLDEVSERLRPGMEGFGKVDVDERRLIWIWTHGLFDWARMKLWRWMP